MRFNLEKQRREEFVFGLLKPNIIERRKAFSVNLNIKAQSKKKSEEYRPHPT